MVVKKTNLTNKYPVLSPQQLLSLIRVNQILIRDLEDRIINLEKNFIGGGR